MIHQVCTYLQIILENKHKKKWESLEKHKISQNGTPASFDEPSKIFGRDKLKIGNRGIFRKSLQRHSFNNASEMMTRISSSHETNECSGFISNKNSPNASPLTSLRRKESTQEVKNNFTFRKRNIKQGFMNKLDSFLDLVENHEK